MILILLFALLSLPCVGMAWRKPLIARPLSSRFGKDLPGQLDYG